MVGFGLKKKICHILQAFHTLKQTGCVSTSDGWPVCPTEGMTLSVEVNELLK